MLAKQNAVAFDPLKQRLTIDENCASLNDYLACFAFPLSLLQDSSSLRHASESLFTELAREGLLYVEVRFAPQFHLEKGLSQIEAVDSVIEGFRMANSKTGILGGIILCCMRGANNHLLNRETVLVAKQRLGHGVLALDLAGAEGLYPTGDFSEIFAYAKSLGIPYTIHAGESAGPASVWDALKMGASRIGHGIHAIEDPALVAYLADKKIPLEVCPTSEVDTHCVSSFDKLPLRQFLDAGVPVCIATDDRTISNTSLAKEYEKITKAFHLSKAEIKSLYLNSVAAAFCDEATKSILQEKIQESL